MKPISCRPPLFLIGTLMFCCIVVHAQVQDNFSDGEFSTDPSWGGETAKFEISAGRLHLNAPAVQESAYLSTQNNAIHNAAWEFYLEMGFATSSTSLTRVYLVSDQADLKQALNGYFVMIGNTADEVSLYKQTGTAITKIIDGPARVTASTVLLRVRVTRDASALWTLYADVGNTGTYTPVATPAVDLAYTTSNYMGVYCLYTQTRSTLFWFDDFNVTGTVAPDLTPPTLLSVQATTESNLLATFDEVLLSSSAQDVSNYFVNKNVGNPITATIQADNKSVLLELAAPMINGTTYNLQASGVQDVDGNVMAPASIDFLYFNPQPILVKDIIVSEFMADPSPVVGLPESEFIELHNRSANPVDLMGWTVSDGTTAAVLPKYILMPASRVVVAPSSTAGLFVGPIGVANFPSLNNTGDNIVVKNSMGATVDSITYFQVWYGSDEKKDGGWSLEIVDPENFCEEEGNWTASENAQGGTPGSQNSVFASNPDVDAPVIVSAVIVSPTKLEVTFNEKLDGSSTPSGVTIPAINFLAIEYSSSLRKIILNTLEDFQPSTTYVLSLSNVFDCPGNALVNNTINVVLPEKAEPSDILINEILFNPRTGGVDFVEVYNKSDKYIGLKKWALANLIDDVVSNPKVIESENLVIAPKSFLVFTSEPSTLKAHYPRTIADVSMATTLPPMNDDEGSVALVDSLRTMIDYFQYTDNYHLVFLKDKEGVSLERVSLSASRDGNNWRSASQAENFATPGYKNSALTDGTSAAEGEVVIEPEVFSPQVPPTDFTLISYRFAQSGFVANASIFDHQGRLIKSLANNEILGIEGFFRWDGDRDDGSRVRAGYYVALIEIFNADGRVNTFRKRVVVTFR
jgi:Lamin Tail Domain/Bacterial Ig-like domain